MTETMNPLSKYLPIDPSINQLIVSALKVDRIVIESLILIVHGNIADI